MRVLIIEDNLKTAQYLSKGLAESRFFADAAYNGVDGLHLFTQNSYDIIILDVMLPQMDGWSVIQKIREINPHIPVLFLTACDAVEQRVKGLELGADDYLVKPFAFSEFLARVRSLLRRQPAQVEDAIQIDDLKLNISKHQAIRGDIPLRLTAKEFMLLMLLMKRTGEVLSRTYIAEQIWDIHFDSDTNAIDVAIKRLRDKVDQDFSQKLIHNVRGVGYVLEAR